MPGRSAPLLAADACLAPRAKRVAHARPHLRVPHVRPSRGPPCPTAAPGFVAPPEATAAAERNRKPGLPPHSRPRTTHARLASRCMLTPLAPPPGLTNNSRPSPGPPDLRP
eukprot:363593-Chlamydomonas_euryale.AAC.8